MIKDGALNIPNENWLEVDLGENKTFSHAYIKEGSSQMTGYKNQYYDGTSWLDAYTGTTIGNTGVNITFNMVNARKEMLYITSVNGSAEICEFTIQK